MQKIDGLEGLRGYMAIWVWVTHVVTMAQLALYKERGWGKLLANGDVAVGVFIILSGFVISASILRSPTSYRDYLTRRAFRLFPVYLVCLAASVLMLDMSISLLQDLPWDGPRTQGRIAYLQASQENFWPHLILHIPLLHGIIPEKLLPYTSYAFMGQAWSLTLEWQFYLVAPFLVLLASRIKMHWWTATLLVVILIFLTFYTGQASFLPTNLYLFFIGYLTYRVWYSNENSASAAVSRVLVRTLLLMACVTVAALAMKGIKGAAVLLWFVAILALQNRLSTVGYGIRRLIDNRFSRWLGLISYDFYCVHMISIFLCAYFLLKVVRVETQASYAILLMSLSLALGLVMSWCLHRLVEQPCMAWGKRLSSAQRSRPHAEPASTVKN